MSNDRSKIQVGVGALIINDEGKIFLAKRGHGVTAFPGLWDTPGGGLEFGETLEEGIKRELHEEHGVEISVGKMLGIVEIIFNSNKHWVAAEFECTITSGEPKILEPDKCEAIGWFTLDEAAKLPLTPFAIQDLENYQKRYSR